MSRRDRITCAIRSLWLDMRIVSLLPSATEIVCLLGLRDSLVGRSHACDFPHDVADVPIMTYSNIGGANGANDADHPLSGAEIDARVSRQLRDGLSLYGVHIDRLEAAQPDLILTQELCDVCAVSTSAVHAAVRELSANWQNEAHVMSLEPTDIDGIIESILGVGELTGSADAARREAARMLERLKRVQTALKGIAHRPTVAALEWMDPPFAPGHWVPEQIEFAGGNPVLGTKAQPSARCTWDDVIHTQAECVVAMPCGCDVAASARAFQEVAALDVWRDLPATYLWQLYAVDATSYFSRPGPRVVEGVEILAGMLHPDRWPAPGPEQAVRVNDIVEAEIRIQPRAP